MGTIRKLEDIEAWKLSRALNSDIIVYLNRIKSFQDYALYNQMNRSCGSIMDNIAESFGRGGNKEFIQFLSYSKGSAEELKSQLYRAFDRKYLTPDEFENLFKQLNTIALKIGAFMSYLKKCELRGVNFFDQAGSQNN